MADKLVRVCDVTGSQNSVERFAVSVCHDGGDTDGDLVFDESFDLCPRALARLKRFIRRGTTKPTPRKGTQSDEPA